MKAGLVIRWASQYRPAPDAVGTGADCPGYPQGAGGWGRRKAKYGPCFRLCRSGRPDASQVRLRQQTSLREDIMMTTNDGAMTRRGVLASAGAGASAAALGGAPASAQTGAPKTFVLVHGAWHGGWCWRRVADLLQKGGHKVFTPTLTGVGERSHLMSKDIVLDTHIIDIVNVIKWEDLNNICLVVHSYGGWPGSGAIEQVLDRISSIVWLDAFKPENGQRGFDFASDFSRKALLTAVEKGEPGRPAPKAEAFHVNEKDRAWVDSKLTAQPNGVALQPIKLTGAREKVAKKTYIRARKYPQPAFARRGGAPRTRRGRRSCLLRRQSGLLDHAPGSDAIVDEEAGKFLRRVQDRLQRAIDELFLAEGGPVADADHVFPDLVDDRLGRARRREQAEIDAGEIAAIAELRQRRNIREQRRALGAVERQARHRAALQMGDEVLQAEERDRRRPRQHGVGGVAAAAEGDGDPVGAALALELFEVERQRKRGRGITQGSRLRLRERHQFIDRLHLERGVDHQRLRVEEQIDDRLEILGGVEGKLL